MRQQRLKELCIDAFHAAGVEVIHALDHADGMRHDHVRAGCAKVVRRQTLEDLVSQAVRRRQRHVERCCIGHASPFEVGGQNLTFVSERSDSLGGAMHEHDTYVQRAEERDVEQQGGQTVADDDPGINRQDEDLLAKLRNVLQDAAQVGKFHVSSSRLNAARCS